ncbi:hypothetical protein NL676_005029 [Syzygium grande]|nr:hypothetical protein NL676_005029 [Syzygium grande]
MDGGKSLHSFHSRTDESRRSYPRRRRRRRGAVASAKSKRRSGALGFKKAEAQSGSTGPPPARSAELLATSALRAGIPCLVGERAEAVAGAGASASAGPPLVTPDDGGSERKRSRSRFITEEDIEAYKARSAQKKAMLVARRLKSRPVAGYSNASNPFGDSNLSEKFVWKKKIERDVELGAELDMFSIEAEKKRRRESMAEIEKAKKRREERALEKARHEEGMAMHARQRAGAEFQDREKKEEEFLFDQSRVRVFQGLMANETEEHRGDIRMHLDSDTATPAHVEYLKALLAVCDWDLAEARKRAAILPSCLRERGVCIPASKQM